MNSRRAQPVGNGFSRDALTASRRTASRINAFPTEAPTHHAPASPFTHVTHVAQFARLTRVAQFADVRNGFSRDALTASCRTASRINAFPTEAPTHHAAASPFTHVTRVAQFARLTRVAQLSAVGNGFSRDALTASCRTASRINAFPTEAPTHHAPASPFTHVTHVTQFARLTRVAQLSAVGNGFSRDALTASCRTASRINAFPTEAPTHHAAASPFTRVAQFARLNPATPFGRLTRVAQFAAVGNGFSRDALTASCRTASCLTASRMNAFPTEASTHHASSPPSYGDLTKSAGKPQDQTP